MQLKFVPTEHIQPVQLHQLGNVRRNSNIKKQSLTVVLCSSFFPLAVETYGSLTPSSLDTIKTIASKVVIASSIPFTQAYSNLME